MLVMHRPELNENTIDNKKDIPEGTAERMERTALPYRA